MMMRRRKVFGVMGAIIAAGLVPGAGTMLRGEDKHDEHPELPVVKPPAVFEQLKQLVGKWEGTKETPDGTEQAAVEYTLTAAGTALAEKLFPGTEHEMLSVYHGDRGDVMMTHYCALGNQPRMRMQASDNPNVFKFVFIDGTSLDSLNDPHMHQLTMTLVGENRLKHEWVFYEDGEPEHTTRLDFKRKG